MAVLYYMAIPHVKSTYSLDLETVAALDDLARRWGVSKSEVLRRTIRAAAAGEGGGVGGPLGALDALQECAGLSRSRAGAWVRQVRTERAATSPKRRR